ncbi:fibronectin-like [Odontesthes bonariensis]|uniref:fibronectin-like n=1 Tax=Odontesthes bonariensis TaxID=219752 RepID=UPI003F58DA24
MDYRLIIVVLTGALLSVAVAQSRQYYFVSTQLTWTSAQRVCRQDFTDLATIENIADVNAVLQTTSNYAGKAWIGLYDEQVNSWKWSLNDSSFYGEGETAFRNWYPNSPNNLGGQQHCVRLLLFSGTTFKWDDRECSDLRPFVCYKVILDETSITLQWNQVNNNVSFVLQFNGTETNISAPDGDGAVTHTVSPLTAGTKYTFTLFSVFENVRSSGLQLTAVTGPQNTESIRPSAQDETSITLQWNQVNNNVSFVLQLNGAETNISAPDGDGAVTHTVSSLTAGTKYTFTLFSVFENVRSSGLQLTAVTAPINTQSFRPSAQNETSITLQWNQVNSNVSFVLQFNGAETNISAPDGDGAVTHTVSSLTAGTKYTFTLFSVFENVRSSGLQLIAVTAPINTQSFRPSAQDETSITLQWNQVNNNVSFVLQFNGTETNISAPDGDGAVTHTVSSLTAGTKYTFTLFSVFENVRSSGLQLTAATAPQNTESFRPSVQDETSITLQWNQVNNNVSFVLQYNGTETNISAPDGDRAVTHTVSSLTAGTKYTFTLFSVFENVRSSGVSTTAATDVLPDFHVILKRRVSQDSPTMSRAFSISVYLLSSLHLNGGKFFLTTLAISPKMMDESSPNP